MTHTAFGYRDLIILPEIKLLYAITTVPKKKFLKKPKTKKTDQKGRTLYAGDVEGWSQKKSDTEPHSYQRLWTIHQNDPAQCLHWNGELNYLFVGYDGGNILVLKMDPKMPLKYRQVVKEKVHKDKVMGVYFDSSRGLMFSVGEDKYLRVYDVKNKGVVSSRAGF